MNKKKIIASVLSLVLVVSSFAACGNADTPGKKNEDELGKAAEGIAVIDEKQKTTLPEVTAITAGVDKDGKVVDKEGIIDESGHRIFATGEVDNKGMKIYSTGKFATNGRLIYTKNTVDSFGKQLYYTGFYKDGKLMLSPTAEKPDYSTNEKPNKYAVPTTTTTTTIGYKNKANFTITDAKSNYIKYFGGSGMDFYRAVTECKDGGFVAACYTTSVNGDLQGASKDWSGHLALVKYNAAGEQVWKYVNGGNGEIILEDVTELKDGTIVAVGSTAAKDLEGAPLNSNLISTLIIRLAKDGTLMWMYTFPGDKEQTGDFANCVDATPDGGFIVGGKANSTAGFFNGGSESVAYLFKFDKNCNLKWRRTLSGSKSNTFDSVSVAPNGDVYATCVTTSTDGDFSALIKGKDFAKNTILVKLNKNGDLKWSKNLDGTGNSEFKSVCATSDGCVVAGSYSVYKRADGIYSMTYGKSDGYVIRYDSDGKVCWARNFGGSDADAIQSITQIDGGFMVAGATRSVDYDFQGYKHGGEEDGFVMILNDSGERCTTYLLDGKLADNVLGLCTLEDGSVIAAGWTNSNNNTFIGSGATNMAKSFVINLTPEIKKEK